MKNAIKAAIKNGIAVAAATVLLGAMSPAIFARDLSRASAADANSVVLCGDSGAVPVAVDPQDYPIVHLAAGIFSDDVQRVTGKRPSLIDTAAGAPQMIIVGTLGHSRLIARLLAAGKIKGLEKVKGHWEATLTQIVTHPFPGVRRALVITGSDRRGTAYGLMTLSSKIGVSPWNWWADVPVAHRASLIVKIGAPEADAPGVKYRGVFINDEDWGINPWASKTFDPAFGNIGPKTYAKVFELMLRLRLNYLWPAMHGCSTEFGSVPENAVLADKYGIVAGASHCEPMLYNNVHWNEAKNGLWNYSLNRDTIHATWEETAKARGSDEAVWTLGIRGIHDRPMQKPPDDLPSRVALLSQVIMDQRALLAQHVTAQYGSVAQCFIPYKEVQTVYDAGLEVPPDVTLIWADDNFGYIRRLSNPSERKRPGGAGVYWHISYYGQPHSYTWIDTTAPAFMWEELHKAWENDARTIWILNVGDIKPMEIGIDYYARLAWNPNAVRTNAQPAFLLDFAAQQFGDQYAQRTANLLGKFYRLGTIHKPEMMNRAWALSLPAERAAELTHAYADLLQREEELAATIPADYRDAYTELVGFPVRVLGETGLIFMADRRKQLGTDAAASDTEITRLRTDLEAQVDSYNTKIAGGKWNRMMPGLETGKTLDRWSSQVRWPWGEKEIASVPPLAAQITPVPTWRDAAAVDRVSRSAAARWATVSGLGTSGRAEALEPASLASSWAEGDKSAPTLTYLFVSKGGSADAQLEFLPTYRLYPGMKLRVAVGLDDGPFTLVEVPGSDGTQDENGNLRNALIQDNYARTRVTFTALTAGHHALTIRAVDPGVVLDRVSLPE